MTVQTETQTLPVAFDATAPRIPWGFGEIFVVSQTALPALLFLPGMQAIRLPIRVAAFGISLAALLWWALSSTPRLPASKAQSWVVSIMALLALMLFHPKTPTVVGGLAHMAVYLAVMAPLLWAPAFVSSPERLGRILWLLLLCSGCNAIVGVLQVYDPARWLPAEFSNVISGNSMAMGTVTFTGINGQHLVRPPGLFDTPGAVAGPAMSAALLGLIFAMSAIPMWKRLLSFVFAGAGFAAIYLSQVRVSLVMATLTLAVYAFTLFRQRRVARATQFTLIAAGIVFGSFLLAVALGGQAITDRVMTLIGVNPIDVYQTARGAQLTVTFQQLLFEAPFGSGLARWGMAAMYFSTFNGLDKPIWAEIQFTGWVIDGGILMVVLYCSALLITSLSEWRIAMTRHLPMLSTCGAVILSLNIGAAMLIFSFTPFVTQIGIQYWFLAGALHGVAVRHGLEGA